MSINHLNDIAQVKLGVECYVVCDNSVLLQKRAVDAEHFPNVWVGPGGHVDDGEDLLTAAIRECYEETGVKITDKDIQLRAYAIHHHIDKNVIWMLPIFLAYIEKQSQTTSSTEGISRWFDINEVLKLENVMPSAKYYFNHVLGNKAGILYTHLKLKKMEIIEIVQHRVDTTQ